MTAAADASQCSTVWRPRWCALDAALPGACNGSRESTRGHKRSDDRGSTCTPSSRTLLPHLLVTAEEQAVLIARCLPTRLPLPWCTLAQVLRRHGGWRRGKPTRARARAGSAARYVCRSSHFDET